MAMSIDAAAEVMREAMREKVKRHSLWYMFQGALMVVAGILAIAHPAMSSVALVIFFGWLLIISGIAQGISLIDARSVPHFWLQLVSVALFIIVGALFLRNPAESLITLTLLVIVFLMVEGISKIIFSLTIRPFPNWGWILLSGIISEGQQTGVFRRSLDPRVGAWELIRTALAYTLTLPLGIPLYEEPDYAARAIECLLECLVSK